MLLIAAAVVLLMPGCKTPSGIEDKTAEAKAAAKDKGRVFLTVDFEQGKTLRYRMASRKQVTLDWDPNATNTKNRVQQHAEQMEMVVAYTPVEVDPYGVSTVRATVESIRTMRSGGPTGRSLGVDAVESAKERSFTIKVDPRGRIVDANELRTLILEMGERAFHDGAGGRVKDPDMIGDFVAGVWFLWDGVATLPLPAEGLTIGQTWSSQLPVPTPMVMRKARDVKYRFNGIRSGPRGAAAVIESLYTPASSTPADWPVPYSGRFRMSGTFGFLGGYEILGLKGTGEELYNIEAGRLEQRRQTYTIEMKASLPPMGIEAHPRITIEQTLITELLNPEGEKSEIRNPKSETNSKDRNLNGRNAGASSGGPF
jgi:hypothetical protein